MRLLTAIITGTMWTTILGAPIAAQERASSSAIAASPKADASDGTVESADLGSLKRIRGALEQPAAPSLIRRADETPTFRVDIRERQRIDELLATLDYKVG